MSFNNNLILYKLSCDK